MNNFKIVFSPAALIDIKEAANWYNSQQKGLGSKFKADVKKVIAAIILNPFFASIKYQSIRTATCADFPFNVHFEISEAENLVRVLSVFHFSRRPDWLKDDQFKD